MKTLSLASLFFLCLAANAATSELNIGGLTPGLPKAAVLKLLGPPERALSGDGSVSETLVYPGVRVELDENHLVAGVRSVAPDVCLGSVCPGIPTAAAQSYLPELRRGFVALSKGEGCWAEVPMKNGRVQAVLLVCQP
jgi:hypothetical protein